MARTKRQSEPEEPQGAPEWMVTFSDCMTLLLTFFVLLLSFSSFDERAHERLEAIFGEDWPSPIMESRSDRSAFTSREQIVYGAEISEGSEKPTLERGNVAAVIQETEPVDFRSRKVFVVGSDKIFWGRGSVISVQGRSILVMLGSFLREVPSRVVISENGPGDEAGGQLGLHRAWAVMEYFVARGGLDKRRFSICGQSAVPTKGAGGGPASREPERVLEVVLLERSIYN
jgi:chemotaxis protein MotB